MCAIKIFVCNLIDGLSLVSWPCREYQGFSMFILRPYPLEEKKLNPKDQLITIWKILGSICIAESIKMFKLKQEKYTFWEKIIQKYNFLWITWPALLQLLLF